MKKITISTTSFGKQNDSALKLLRKKGFKVLLNPYGRKVKPDEIVNLAKDSIGLVAGTELLKEDVLMNLPKLRVISRVGVGIDNIDLACAKKCGISVFNTPSVLTESVAELIIGMIMDCLRGITYSDRQMREGKWNKYMGSLLNGKTVGIVGLGKIGSRVARILKNTFKCRIVYFDTFKTSKKFEKLSQDKLFSISDIISFNSSSTELVLDSINVKKLKKGVIIINASRGNLIDDGVIYKALKDGTVSFAALDVYNNEPYHGKLLKLPNVVLTPHIGSYAIEARVEMEKQAVQNLLKGLDSAR